MPWSLIRWPWISSVSPSMTVGLPTSAGSATACAAQPNIREQASARVLNITATCRPEDTDDDIHFLAVTLVPMKMPSMGLLRDPERVRLVEPDIPAGIPGVIAFLGHVAYLGADHDRLADAVHRADGEYLVSAGLQDLVPRLATVRVVGRVLPFLDVVEELAGGLHVALLALLALGFDVHAPARPLQAAL